MLAVSVIGAAATSNGYLNTCLAPGRRRVLAPPAAANELECQRLERGDRLRVLEHRLPLPRRPPRPEERRAEQRLVAPLLGETRTRRRRSRATAGRGIPVCLPDSSVGDSRRTRTLLKGKQQPRARAPHLQAAEPPFRRRDPEMIAQCALPAATPRSDRAFGLRQSGGTYRRSTVSRRPTSSASIASSPQTGRRRSRIRDPSGRPCRNGAPTSWSPSMS